MDTETTRHEPDSRAVLAENAELREAISRLWALPLHAVDHSWMVANTDLLRALHGSPALDEIAGEAVARGLPDVLSGLAERSRSQPSSASENPGDTLAERRLAEIEAAVNAEGFTEGPWTPLYEGCECGGDHGCGHGEYVWAIHTPAPRRQSVEHAQRTGEPVGDYAYQRSELAEFTSADLEFIAEARTAVPELLAEVKRLRAELDKYVGWEPTVEAEYEHAVAQSEACIQVVRDFKRDHEHYITEPDRDEAVTALVVALEQALEVW